MAITVVQGPTATGVNNNFGANPISTLTCTFNSSVVAGHALVVGVEINFSQTISSISDNVNGSVYTLDATYVGNSSIEYFYHLNNCGSGSTTVTVNTGGTCEIAIWVWEISASGPISFFGSSHQSGGGGAISSGNINVTNPPCFLAAIGQSQSIGPGTVASGWTGVVNAGTDPGAWQVDNTVGNIASTWTGSTDSWDYLMVGYTAPPSNPRCASPAVIFENTTPPSNNLLSALDTAMTLPITALNDGSLGYWNGILADTGAVNAYAVTLNFGTPSAYNQGMVVSFLAANTNTGASTIAVSPLGTAPILNPAGNALTGSEIQSGRVTHLFFDGASFRLLWYPIMKDLGNIGGTLAQLNCSGANTIFCSASNSNVGGASTQLQLLNVAYGTPVMVRMNNTAGSGTQTWFLNLLDLSSNNVTVFGFQAGTLTQLGNGGPGVGIAGGHQILFYGIPWMSGSVSPQAYMIQRNT